MRTLAALAALALSTASALAEIVTRHLTYQDGDTALQGFLAYDDAITDPRPGILVIHEWWGQTEYARNRARQLAEIGYVAFAVDMYGGGATVTTPQEAQRLATPFYQDRGMARARITAALDTLRQQEQVDKDRIAAIGYCFGGTIALELARSGADVKGVVSFHGGLGTPTPEDARNIKAKVLVATGAVDPMVKAEEREAFIKEMEDAKVDYQMIIYGRAVHSFTNPDADKASIPGVAYQQEADHRSWEHMQTFFEEIFGGQRGQKDEIDRARAELVRSIEQNRSSMIAQDEFVRALSQEYAGTLAVRPLTIEQGHRHIQTMLTLLAQWNPIGFTLEHLDSVLGEPTDRTDDTWVYRFISGRGALQVSFHHDRGDRVSALTITPGE